MSIYLVFAFLFGVILHARHTHDSHDTQIKCKTTSQLSPHYSECGTLLNAAQICGREVNYEAARPPAMPVAMMRCV